jgi:anti-sigma B factor antagonist
MVGREEAVIATSVSTSCGGNVLTIAVTGDIDLVTGPVVETAIAEAVTTPGISEVHVDLSAVGFLDSSGIAVLLKGRRSADEHDVAFRVAGAQGSAKRVLEMTGVWPHLSGEPDPL